MLLIVSKNLREAVNFSDMLNFMGVLSLSVTPEEFSHEYTKFYRGIIVLSSDKIDDEKWHEFCTKDVPIFAVGSEYKNKNMGIFLSEKLSASEIFESVRNYCESKNIIAPGEYKNHFLDVSLDKKCAEYFGYKIPVTKTEIMILRALLSFYPKPVNAHEILKVAFRKNREPDVASVRTHISIINKKAIKNSGRKLILNIDNQGYRISKKENPQENYVKLDKLPCI